MFKIQPQVGEPVENRMARAGTLQEVFYPTEPAMQILDSVAKTGIKKSAYINRLILEAAGKLPTVRISDEQLDELVKKLRGE